jgi:hypothetical protein
MNAFCLFLKRLSEAIPPFDIRYSIFDILRFAFSWFCGSLFQPCEVSSEVSGYGKALAKTIQSRPAHPQLFIALW